MPEAAEALGVTVDAIRGRVRRGILQSERESGTVYVWVDPEEADRWEPSSTSRGPSSDQSELVATLREALEAEREANRENRRIIAALTSRIPQLEPPSESPGTPETVSEEPEPRSDTTGPQAATRRSWWRRVFRG